ncbi:recombinase family protein [Flavisphingomonas formosensis]|uniref:recombinase family protein n=1 Tax=Flavisphingomonas formosensis TaxID=861534 RepID=UPI0012F99EB4|nr:recombinase family protein [Sphingomonas formosensis]
MEAILYSRWSSLEQTSTTSAPRQLEICEAFAAARSFDIVERVVDEGRSAWTGDNLINGRLGQLTERFKREGAQGKVLVVEKLDRISRQSPLVVTQWLQRVCGYGLTIMTADGRHTLDADALIRNQLVVVGLIFEAFKGYQESQDKSDRVKEAWERKRERRAPMTRICPAWLTIDQKSTHFKSADNLSAAYSVIENRAAIVREIFNLTEQGRGKSTIARMLNERSEPVWGRGDGWHASYIQKILTSPAVYGEYQPHTRPKGGERRPVGEPIQNYFPAVIEIEQFERVNDQKARAILAKQRPANPLANLLAGIAKCGNCGGWMMFVNKGDETLADGSVVKRGYLKCSNAHRAKGCDRRQSYGYRPIESALLDQILHLAMDDQHFSVKDDAAELEARVLRLKHEVKECEKRQAAAHAKADDPDDDFAIAKYRESRDATKAAKNQLQDAEEALAKARGSVSPAEHVRRVNEVRSMMHSDNAEERYQARSRVKLAINDIVKEMIFHHSRSRIAVTLKGGVRSFVIYGDTGEIGSLLPAIAADTNDPIQAAYKRRKEALEPVSEDDAPIERTMFVGRENHPKIAL